LTRVTIASQDFASGTDSWTNTTNESGRLKHENTGSGATSSVRTYGTTPSKTYRVSFDADVSGSSIDAGFDISDGSVSIVARPLTADGRYHVDFIATSATTEFVLSIGSGSGTRTVYLDNILLEETNGDPEGYRFGFNGKENDYETYYTGNVYDYGDRIYSSRLGRFISLDPLQRKYPSLTPYHFTGNSPIIFVDHDGKDFGVTVDHSSGTILITANVYTTNKQSYVQALNASGELNSLSKTATINGKQYTVSAQINVVPPAEKGAQNGPNYMTDPAGNLYKGTTGSTEFVDGKAVGGKTLNGKVINMNNIEYSKDIGLGATIPVVHNAGNNKKLVSHEFLHLLGQDDKGGTYFSTDGRMNYTATPGNSFDMKDISNQDVANILKYAVQNDGKKDINSAKVNINQTGNGDIKSGDGNIKVEDKKK
jgi:RHS repeat-associated protein